MTVKIIIWELLCLAMFWGSFCRSVRTDKDTHLDVRMAILILGMSSLMGLGAPLYGWSPDMVIILMVASIVIKQVVTAQYWRGGVPERFTKARSSRNRRSGDLQ